MKLPDNPQEGKPVLPFAQDTVAWMRSNAISNVIGGKMKRTPGGIVLDVTQPPPPPQSIRWPFRLTATNDGSTVLWRVSSQDSFISYLTNGVVIDLTTGGADWKVGGIPFDTDTEIEATKVIVLKAAVTGLAPSNWELVAADPAVATEWQEVHFDGGTGEQDEVRLIVGVVIYNNTTSIPTAHCLQSVFAPQMLTTGLVNGAAAIQFITAPIHPDSLVP